MDGKTKTPYPKYTMTATSENKNAVRRMSSARIFQTAVPPCSAPVRVAGGEGAEQKGMNEPSYLRRCFCSLFVNIISI